MPHQKPSYPAKPTEFQESHQQIGQNGTRLTFLWLNDGR
jgi:hypothetical protein